MKSYATVDELEDFLDGDPTPAHPERLLSLASTEIDALLAGCVYTVNSSGLPTETADANKLRDLTILQAVWMADDEKGDKAGWSEIRTSSVTVVRGRGATAQRFAPRAVAYLQAEGFPGQGIVIKP